MSNFLQNGHIDLIGADTLSRKAIYNINIPYILLVHALPSLSRYGSVNSIAISDELLVWQQEIKTEHIKPEYLKLQPGLSSVVWSELKTKIESFMAYYVSICHILKNPSIVSNFLPIGIYINMKYVCSVDQLPLVLEELQRFIHIDGIAEFQHALCEALVTALKAID